MEEKKQIEGLEVELKIFEARSKIRKMDIKKGGRNDHSNYDYFTPEQISELVTKACEELQILNLFTLVDQTEDNGNVKYYGVVNVIDLESGKSKEFRMQTFVPDIKATNAAQKIGGAVTYSERYLLMTIYDIKDSNLDFDNDKSKSGDIKQNNKPEKPKQEFEKRTITSGEVNSKWNGIIYKKCVYINNVKIMPPSDQLEKLRVHTKFKEEK